MWMAIAPTPWRPEWQAPLVDMAAAITPAMAWHDQALLLDVKASLQWLGGVRGLKRRVQAELTAIGANAHVAIALTAPGAWLLAIDMQAKPSSLAWRYALSAKRLTQRLETVSIDLMPQAARHGELLHRMGCHALGQLKKLDRSELAARTDVALIKALDQTYGQAVFGYQPLKLPPQFQTQLELPYLAQNTQALAPYLKRLLQALCQWLTDHHLALSRLECRLRHRDRRRAWQPTTLMLAVRHPTDSFALLWRWLQLRLERTSLPAPVSDIGLVTRTLAPRDNANLLLFGDDQPADESISETLDLLRARLGQACVQQAVPKADYRLELANTWQTEEPGQPSPVVLEFGPHCPSWLLTEPKPLTIRQDQPCLQGPLRLLQGPYRIETGWWDHSLALRDYFVATDASERRYWIYRERDQFNARWFLQGLFG